MADRERWFWCVLQLMILMDGAGDEWPLIGHAMWNGCNLADFVMPFFLFIVGMAIPLSLKVHFTFFPLSVHIDRYIILSLLYFCVTTNHQSNSSLTAQV